MADDRQCAAAQIYLRKGRLLCVSMRIIARRTRDGRMAGSQSDMELYSRLTPSDVPDDVLGAVVREALFRSPEEPIFRSWMGYHRKGSYRSEHEMRLAYDPDENDKLARLFGLGTRRGLFSGMRYVGVQQELGQVAFMPTWRASTTFRIFREGAEGAEDAVVQLPSADAALGIAARDALARSSG